MITGNSGIGNVIVDPSACDTHAITAGIAASVAKTTYDRRSVMRTDQGLGARGPWATGEGGTGHGPGAKSQGPGGIGDQWPRARGHGPRGVGVHGRKNRESRTIMDDHGRGLNIIFGPK